MYNMCINNIVQFENRLEIKVIKSKTDQYRHGDTVHIAATAFAKYCPVRVATQYLALLKSSTGCQAHEYVLTGLQRTPAGLRTTGRRATNKLLTQQLRDALTPLVDDVTKYSLHSFRSGGATAAAASQTVSRQSLKMHGRWKSDCVDRYIHVPIAQRLDVTKSIL
jgi:hypothetical protein